MSDSTDNAYDSIHDWQIDLTLMLNDAIEPEDSEDSDGLLVDVDEVAFFGALPQLPEGLEYLEGIGTVDQPPEVYVVGVKDGFLLGPEVWMAPPLGDRLRELGFKLQDHMRELPSLCQRLRVTVPSVVMTALVLDSGEAVTIQEFDRIEQPPYQGMTPADWAFDKWVQRIEYAGSAYEELMES